MNGQLVIVKDFIGRPLLRRVCHAAGSKVFVTSESVFELIKKGKSELSPIGFDLKNVFAYDGRSLTGSLNWKSLKPWQG